MGFPENLKLAVKRRAQFTCCLCKSLGVEVHHIIPESEAGPDSEDNAAPLCPSCHETYGANPIKRKFIRESRDFWYEICEKRYASDPDRLNEIGELLKQAATKDDLNRAVDKMSVVWNDAALSNPREFADRVAQAVHQRITRSEAAERPEGRFSTTQKNKEDEFYAGARAGVKSVAKLLEDLSVTVDMAGHQHRREIGRDLSAKLLAAAELVRPPTHGD